MIIDDLKALELPFFMIIENLKALELPFFMIIENPKALKLPLCLMRKIQHCTCRVPNSRVGGSSATAPAVPSPTSVSSTPSSDEKPPVTFMLLLLLMPVIAGRARRDGKGATPGMFPRGAFGPGEL